MNRRQCTKFSRRLTQLWGEGTKTLADILRVFNALADRSVRYKPCHNQLGKAAFPTFTWQLFDHLLQHLVLRVLGPVPGDALRCFDDVLRQDGTYFAVVDGERQFLPTPGDLRRKLLRADRGDMDVASCRRVHDAGGSFIVRFQTGVNPVGGRATVGGARAPLVEWEQAGCPPGAPHREVWGSARAVEAERSPVSAPAPVESHAEGAPDPTVRLWGLASPPRRYSAHAPDVKYITASIRDGHNGNPELEASPSFSSTAPTIRDGCALTASCQRGSGGEDGGGGLEKYGVHGWGA